MSKTFLLLRCLLLSLLLSAPALAAQLPTPDQARAALQQPGAAEAVRARLAASGMTPEQIRARLQASGYDPALLDAYLNTTGTAAGATVTRDQGLAMKALGLTPDTSLLAPMPVDTGLRKTPERAPSKVFGVDVFRRSTTQFLPVLSGPVSADYRLGAGDVLMLILTGDVELTHQLNITREGFVLIPQVGQVYLANLTLAQARNVIAEHLSKVYSGVRRTGDGATQFTLSVASVRAVQVHVIGEVSQPTAYQVSALSTVLTALYSAGGITELANPRAITVRRGGAIVATFDLYDYLLAGNTQNDVRLENGDIVFVGVRGRRVSVEGGVLRPASYDLKPTETLADLLADAGGLQADAARNRVSIERIVPPAQRSANGAQRVTIDVPLVAGSATIPPVPVEDGDIVTVHAVSEVSRNFVRIEGSVYAPGRFGLEPGFRLSQLVARAGGLLPGTYAGRAHISRLNRVDQTRRLIPVMLPSDSTMQWLSDPAIEDQDSIVIYNRLDMRPQLTIAVAGAVNHPGQLPWREGMTLRDAILQAAGLAPGASLDSAEIARLPSERGQGQLAVTIRAPLDSSYLFDRDSLGRPIGPPGTAFRASGAGDILIQPFDNVLIFRQPDFTYQRTVTITGEVRFPGTYSLRNKNERLTDLIGRAGGLTDRAYIEGIRFVRWADSIGRLDVNFPKAIAQPGSASDLVLLPNDEVVIPNFQPSVKIQGAVNSPGSVLWEPGEGLDYYISAAGGMTPKGDKKAVSVRQANGKTETRRGGFLFIGRESPVPSPGSIVTIPLKEERPYRDNTALLAAIASIVASTATMLIALGNRSN